MDSMKSRKQNIGLKKETIAQDTTKREKLQKTGETLVPHIWRWQILKAGESSTQSFYTTQCSPTCLRARQEKQEMLLQVSEWQKTGDRMASSATVKTEENGGLWTQRSISYPTQKLILNLLSNRLQKRSLFWVLQRT